MKKKVKFPTTQEILSSKKLPIIAEKDKVWNYLEKEMQEKAKLGIKPYNEKVGRWLKFLKDLKHNNYVEGKRNYKRLVKQAGPAWFQQLSVDQKTILAKMTDLIAESMLKDSQRGIQAALYNLGITINFPDSMLQSAISNSHGDVGIFIWNLFCLWYKVSPAERLPKYDYNSRLMVSALVFVDIEECLKELQHLTTKPHPKSRPVVKNGSRHGRSVKWTLREVDVQGSGRSGKWTFREVDVHGNRLKEPTGHSENVIPEETHYYQPKCRYGMYLSKMKVNCPPKNVIPKKVKGPLPFDYEVKLRNKSSLEEIAKNTANISIVKRIQKINKLEYKPRQCNYNFWRPPAQLRIKDPVLAAEVSRLENISRLKPKPAHLIDVHTQTVNAHVGTVAYSEGRPYFLLHNFTARPTACQLHNGGHIKWKDGYLNHILGHCCFGPKPGSKCMDDCDCMKQWGAKVMNFAKKNKCNCGHLYDYLGDCTNEKLLQTFFYPPTKHYPLEFDKSKILFEEDNKDSFIKEYVTKEFDHQIQRCHEVKHEEPRINPENLPINRLLGLLLHDLVGSGLLLPHLPDADLLLNLQAWTRKRIKGDISPKLTKRLIYRDKQTWRNIDHMEFRAQMHRIPWKKDILEKLNFSHRHLLQEINEELFKNFKERYNQKQLDQSRLLWSTMRHDMYPDEKFLDAYYSYMPARSTDIHYISPFNPTVKFKGICGNTCHLEKPIVLGH